MFLGEYQHSLDSKGRIVLPARFRHLLVEGCVLAPGPDGCLRGYSREEWSKVASTLSDLRKADPSVRDQVRFVFNTATDDVPDQQGRFFIPENLRTYASLERDLIVSGQHEYFEIWDRERFRGRVPEQTTEPVLSY